MTRPPKSLLDPSFRYVSASNTNIAKTFARIRREMKAETPKPPEPPANVRTLQRKKA
jgi:hypothetical protein